MTVFKSKLKDVAIPDVDIFNFIFPPTSIFSRFFGTGVPPRQGKTAYIDGVTGEAIGHDGLKDLCEDFAAALQGKYGLKEQEVLGVFSPNDAYYPIALWGALRIGCIATTANHTYTTEELVHQLRDSGAKVLLTHPVAISVALGAANAVGIPNENILLFSRDESDVAQKAFPTIKELLSEWGAKRAKGSITLRNFKLGKDAKDRIAFLCYSSGTTGRSKGVMISHRNVIANVCQVNGVQANVLSERLKDVLLAVLPFYHIYGLILLIHIASFRGNTTVVLPKFDPPLFLSSIQKYKVTTLYLVPPIILFLAQHPVVDQFDTSSVGIVFSGAAPLPWEAVNQLKKRKGFKNTIVQQGWGMTETATVVTMTPPEDVRVNSIGQIIPNLEIKLVDPDTHEEVGVDKEGEIWVRGPNVTLGYLNNKKATEETYKDGWLLTGDIGVADKDGHFYIRDRIKELIKVKGLQVAPAELEALLLEHPAVADSCVVQVPDERAGELPRAYVVLKESHKHDDQDDIKASINSFFGSKLARHKQLEGGIVFVDSVPKSASGKLLRRFLRDRAKQEWAAENTRARL
ncbi:acetyl-CoA synthetase-like protein [Gonapodya prolifera JEL478]|uniref:Acetyl-CoA synthetase-like protein n=1 Tax=Gonapodya prolifera (strain JEL478) TaxID=1344416 RepID=A0A139AGM6_GONPJ|nr:acetyl-CoA synthetase-like protein [Gonapodya prolifera JEL478]|eukprot:KXS15982.1 acetyl-CoA synthetase-like protein [Gonapodya prolifera JEL478]